MNTQRIAKQAPGSAKNASRRAVLIGLLVCIGSLVGSVPRAHAQIGIMRDSSFSGSNAALATQLIWSHTVTTGGTNSILIVGVGIKHSAATVSSVFWKNLPLTQLTGAYVVNSGTVTDIWYRLNPAATTGQVVVTINSGRAMAGGSVCLLNVNTTSPDISRRDGKSLSSVA